MPRLAALHLAFVVGLLGLGAAKADSEPSAPATTEAEAARPSPVEDWSQLSPGAYRASRDREEERSAERGRDRERRTRPDWLVLEDASTVTQEDATRVHRAGILLATGIPPTIAGLFAIGFGTGNECSEGFVGSGVFLTTVGLGLDIGGLIALAGTSKAARRAPKSRKHRARMAGAAIGSTFASAAIAVGPGIVNIIDCD